MLKSSMHGKLLDEKEKVTGHGAGGRLDQVCCYWEEGEGGGR